jgi:glycosyltransferase involved in cell wall biosynthesis
MRVIFLSPVGTIGGAETSLLGLITGLRRIVPGAQLRLVAGADGTLIERARTLGVEAETVALGQLLNLGDSQLGRMGCAGPAEKFRAILRNIGALPQFIQYTRKLRRMIMESRPDVVHSNGMKMHAISACSTPLDVPLIWQIHDYISSRTLMRSLLRGAMLRRPVLVGVSRSVAEDIHASLRCGPQRITSIYNSVDQQEFASAGPRADLDRLAGMAPAPAGTVRIGLVGTFARWKGHEVFLSALAAVPSEIPFRAYIVGAPLYATPNSQYSFEELKAKCHSLRIADRVAFTGHCDRTSEVYRALDIVVHASVAPEPFGMVLAEAMSTGTAIVTTAYGGAAELCSDGENCLVCRPGDSASMSRAIVDLCVNVELRRRLAEAGLARAPEWFSPERAAAAMIHVYLRAIDLKQRTTKWDGTKPANTALTPLKVENFMMQEVRQDRQS